MAEPMTMIGDQITTNASRAIGNLINVAISKSVDYFLGESKEERKKRLNEYYDRVKVIVDEHQRVTPLFSSDASREGIGINGFGATPQQRALQELDEVDSNLMGAVRMIETARDKSRCGVCKSKIDDTLKIIKETTIPIFDAQNKIRAIQRLKAEGKLDPNALWEMLTPDQKKIVERLSKDIEHEREVQIAQESALSPATDGLISTGEEEEFVIQSPRKPRAIKPRAVKPRAVKPRAVKPRARKEKATPKRKKSHKV